MDATMVAPRPLPRKRLSTLTLATSAAVALTGAALVYVQVMLIGMMVPPLAIFVVISFIIAGLMATGWRWLPLLGSLWLVFLFSGNSGPIMHNLSYPAELHGFGFSLIFVALVALGTTGGVLATVQNYRVSAEERRTPRWLPASLMGAVAIVVGMLITAAIPQHGVLASISPEALAAFPSFAAKNFEFEQKEIRAKVGETVALRLVSGDLEAHSFDIDELNVHALMPTNEEGLALFKPTQPGTYTFYCAPHYDKASGEGMKGTLIVE